MSDVQLFIDGVWRDGSAGGGADFVNPATEECIGRVAHAGEVDVAAAIDAAEMAFLGWRDTEPAQRAGFLRCAAKLIEERSETAAIALTREQGKTLAESRAEFTRVVHTLEWHADAALGVEQARSATDRSVSVLPEPIGVVGAFTPWNYPAVIIARKLGAALAAGCSIVLKAAEETPSTAAFLIATLEEAGLPRGVVNLVFGKPPAISAQMLDSPIIRAFSFTGSTSVGKQLAGRAARSLKRCVLELGGHAPVLVFGDADLDATVKAVAAYKFECAGQSCNAPSRIYVQEFLYERFVEAFAEAARGLCLGDGLDPSTDMGPMANPRRLAATKRLTDDARSDGARIVTGGERIRRPGYFWPPTVLVDVPDTAALMHEEPFGPVAPISRFSTFDEAIACANATVYGLAAYVFTRSNDTAEMAARAIAAGSVGINELEGVPPDVGIAGIKDSGYGYEGGHLGIEAFLNLKVVRGNAIEARNQ
jgi:succinate-semialdehyde dehydrogenase/glutarate-semialdehyde dehydrogenase